MSRSVLNLLVCVLVLSGCAAQVVNSSLSDQAGVLTAYYKVESKSVFSRNSGRVTLTAELSKSAVKTPFKVVWVAPNGRTYGRDTVERIPGTRFVTASMPIRNGPANELPGVWKVRLYRGPDQVLERVFTVQ